MNTNQTLNYFDELDDYDLNENGKPRHPFASPKKINKRDAVLVKAQDDSRASFKFTYKAARFEEWWLLDSLGDLYEHQWISDVLARVKGGKEASVYLCKPGPAVGDDRFVAAKVYRPRSLRNLKNDQQYRDGRVDLNEDGNSLFKEADVQAMRKRTSYGEELRHQSWIAHEFVTLEKLFDAGADVPKPFAMTKNAILMDFIGDRSGTAPALNEISLDRSEAKELFDRAIWNIDLLLAHKVIHGDLSAYNILYWDGEIKLIDFPQIVSPEGNRNAYRIFSRDVHRVCEYFAKQGVKIDSRKLVDQIWIKHGYPLKHTVDPKFLDPENEDDVKLWKQSHK